MFSREEIEKRNIDTEVIKEIKKIYCVNQYKDVNTINKVISKIIVHINTIEGIPKFVLTRAIYSDNDNGISMIRITVRPSKGYLLNTKDMKKVETFIDIDSFYNDFIDFLLTWVDDYIKYAKIELNIVEFNKYIEDILFEGGIRYNVNFTIGNIIEDIQGESIKIGINENIAIDLKEIITNLDKEEIRNIFLICENVYDIFNMKVNFTILLGIYSKKSIVKILRTYVKKDIRNVRTGIGYIETEDKFGIVERVAVKEEEIEKIKEKNEVVIVEENKGITKREKEKNKTKIVSFYRVKPFKKE